MKKILIVSYYFPPLNAMASKRYGYMCKYFRENGYEPVILTTHVRSGAYLDAKMDLPVPIEDENIIRIGMMEIRYPIESYLLTLILDWMGDKGKKSRILEAVSLGWFYKVKNSLEYEKLRDIDAVIGSFPAIGNILVAKYVSQKLKVPFITEVRDLISDYEEGFNRSEMDRKIERILERIIISGTAGIIPVTLGFERILKKRYPEKRIMTIYNGWEMPEQKMECKNTGEYLYYAGSLYEHRVESIKILIDAIKKTNINTTVLIRSLGPQRLTEKIKTYVKELGMESQILIKEATTEDVVKKEQLNAKINLLFSSVHKDDLALMTTLPGKLFELINIDKPVLAIVDSSAEIGEILTKTNKGIATYSESEIFSFIVNDYQKYGGNDHIKDYSRKNQAKKLCDFIGSIIRED